MLKDIGWFDEAGENIYLDLLGLVGTRCELLRFMSPTSYQAAPPREYYCT